MSLGKRLSPNDLGSYSLPEVVVVTHIDIELAADFENDTLKVFVDLSITKIDETCDYIILDNIDLNVISIKNKNGRILLDYNIGDRLDVFSFKLETKIPSIKKFKLPTGFTFSMSNVKMFAIYYNIDIYAFIKGKVKGRGLPGYPCANASVYSGLHSNKLCTKSIHIYLANVNLLMLLRQDTSINKIYILAKITAFKPLTVLMSSVPLEVIDNGDTHTFLFQQTVPVQSYLIAPAYGILAIKTLSPI